MTTASRRLRVGIVGAGLVARVMHLHYLREMADRFEIAAICDLAPENAALCAERFDIAHTFTDWREMLAEPLDAVLILTSGSHAEIAVEAARRGIHVLVEKPMCFSTAEGRAMVEAADVAGVVLMVGYMKRYDEAYLRFREAVGSLADTRFVRVTTLEAPIAPYVGHLDLGPSARPDAAVLDRLESEAEAAVTAAIGPEQDFGRTAYRGILLDTLVHEFNAVRGLLGEPDRLDWVDLQPGMVTVMLRFGELPVAIHWVDLQGIARYNMEFAAYSAERRLTLSFPSPFLRSEPTHLLIEDGDPGSPLARVTDQVTSYDSAFRRELVAFRKAILDGSPIPTTGRDGLADIALCEAIVRSYRTGAPIDQPSSPSTAEVLS